MDLAGCADVPVAIWREIENGAAQADHGFRECVLGTVDAEGAPRLRTVILRDCDPAQRLISVHTDARSDKAAEIARAPQVAILFYSREQRLQLRARGIARLSGLPDARARDAFTAAKPASLAVYRTAPAPGIVIAAPDGYRQDKAPDEGDPQADPAAETFRLLDLQVTEMDVLQLAREGHRRCRLIFTGQAVTIDWLAP